ncbi:MAG TPA: flavin reductase [Terriglobales bacterium]|nr:flavin reductase [Terriglobales bacterium]
MLTIRRARTAVRTLVFGPPIPQFSTVGLPDPQSEVRVWLRGLGALMDVTDCNVIAAARPFTVGVGFEHMPDGATLQRAPLFLDFSDRPGEPSSLLGNIQLSYREMIRTGSRVLCLFSSSHSTNRCLSRNLVWRRYLEFARQQRRVAKSPTPPEIQMITREYFALSTFYICPRPVVLVSVVHGNASNIFPMDLIGPIGGEHFSLALHSTSTAVPLIERSRRVALSSVPVEQISIAYALGQNHKKTDFHWNQVSFDLTTSPAFGLPVPVFALRVREMEIEKVHALGSHKLFICRIMSNQLRAHGLQLSFVQGFYYARRQQTQPLVPATRIA